MPIRSRATRRPEPSSWQAGAVALAAGLVLAGCAGSGSEKAVVATPKAAAATASSAAPAPVTAAVVPPTTVPPAPVRTAAAPRATVVPTTQAPAPVPAPVPAPAPSVSRTVHLTDEECGPQGLTFDVVFSDGHVVPSSTGPSGSVPTVTVSGPAPYAGTFSVDDPTVDC